MRLGACLLLTACIGSKLTESGAVAPDSAADSTDPRCVGAATLDWDNFGHGFLTVQCDGCHASTAADRYGAPEDLTFDTVDEAWSHADSIVGVATGEAPIMPPRGGVSEDDRVRLGWWLLCGVPGR